MNMIFKISLRNLIRQKRRNVLLGITIAFGMSILIISNAFSSGISDLLLNRIIVWITGHIRVTMQEQQERSWQIIRDVDRMKQVIRDTVQAEVDIFEDVSAEGRALGKGGVESIRIKGVELSEGFFRDMKTSSGRPEDILNPNIENPLILYSAIAENLHVQVNDQIQIGFESVYRQVQTAKFTVVAILAGDLPFISSSAYTHINILKPLLGYQPQETGALNIVVKDLTNPAFVLEQAERLHQAFTPDVAGYVGTLQSAQHTQSARFFAVTPDTALRQSFASMTQIVSGLLEDTFADTSAIMISEKAAAQFGVQVGDHVSSTYTSRFDEETPNSEHRIGAIFTANNVMTDDMVFVNPGHIYHTIIPVQPAQIAAVDASSPLRGVLLTEWTLLERSPDMKALELKYDELADSNWQGAVLDVQTMYELGKQILNFELALKIITLIAVLILFFIILIGVVNTLRMTIRERTREIGTNRAIGMQRNDVRLIFLTEVLFLAIIACVTGIIAGYGMIQLLSLISFEAEGIFLFLLVNKHLYFLPTLSDMLANMLFIGGMVLLTAFFPASRAANMSVVGALRHYE